ncbi:MAG: ECF transporter S component [Clostridium sp.]|jgi:energy-coupling factor transport system substrate-specific component
MKRMSTIKLTMTALCTVINIAGAYIALLLRLPIYLDSIGTILGSALLGPSFGMLIAFLSGIISGATADVYSFYFIPVGMITGCIAGFLFRTNWLKKWKLPLGNLFLTIPGTIVSSCIAAFLFGGVTSSGSSLLVQILHHYMGLNLVFSTFIVQILTDYADRLIAVMVVNLILIHLDDRFKTLFNRRKSNETL